MILKDSTGHSPFKMRDGLEFVIPIEYIVPNLITVISERLGDVESNFSKLVTLENIMKS